MTLRERRRFAFLTVWGASLVHLGALALALNLDDDRASALLAALSIGFAVVTARRWLGLGALAPGLVYLYVLGVFHLGLAIPWALGLGSDPVPEWLLTNRLTPALSLVILAVGAYQLGLSLAVSRRPVAARPPAARFHNTVMYQVGLAVMAMGLLSLLWGVRALGFDRMANATYFEVYQLVNTYDPRFFATSLQIAPMGLYLAAAAAPWNRLRVVGLVGGFWIGAIFVLGFRGFALVPLATTAAVLYKRGLRPPRWVYVAGALVLLLAIPAIRGARDDRLADRSVANLLLPAHPLAALEEMGGSLRPLVHTVSLMENEERRWGSTYWQAAAMVVPNLSVEWQGERYLTLDDLPPSHWVSRLAAPWHYAHHGGLGFSAVAEPYMNFGPAGVALCFLALGVALVSVDRLDASRPLYLAMWAMVLGPLLWTTRNSAGVFFRPAVWGIAVTLGAYWLSQWLARIRRVRGSERAAGRKVIDVHVYN